MDTIDLDKNLWIPSQDGKKCVSILSGGLDSTILTYALVDRYGRDMVHAITFDYNQKHRVELEKAAITTEKLGIRHKVLAIPFLGEINKDFSSLSAGGSISVQTIEETLGLPQPSQYVANRNSILINIAVSYAETIGADKVFYGAQSHDIAGFWDCTQAFIDTLNNTYSLNREHLIKVYAPFINMWKDAEIKWGLKLKVPFEDTWTCYNGGDKACGKCPACAERRAAFAKAGIFDPVEYMN
jgi:7-cyano-7-deazaguanine synthase